MADQNAGDLAGVPDAIRQLQRSNRYGSTLAVVGLIATLVAAGTGSYYLFHVSSKIADAQHQLAVTQGALVATQVNLNAAKSALVAAQPANPSRALAVKTALAHVESSQGTLRSASAALDQATNQLPTPATPTDPNSWMTVIGSYSNVDGANQKAAAVRQGGTCAEVWRSDDPAYYVVVSGHPADEATARQRVAIARRSGIARDAYVKSGSNWTPLLVFPDCANISGN